MPMLNILPFKWYDIKAFRSQDVPKEGRHNAWRPRFMLIVKRWDPKKDVFTFQLLASVTYTPDHYKGGDWNPLDADCRPVAFMWLGNEESLHEGKLPAIQLKDEFNHKLDITKEDDISRIKSAADNILSEASE